jgi:excisionase family DNA binding protein
MPAIIRGHVSFVPKEPDALFRDGEVTTAEAAVLAGCTTERIRQLIKQKRIGRWEPRLRMYVVDRAKLDAHLASRKRKPRP